MTRGHTVELFVRSLAPTGGTDRIQRTLDRLDTLVERDVLSDYSVTVWGPEIRTDGLAARTETGRHVYDSLEAFEEWAASEGVRLDRFYETRTVERELADASYTVRSLPTMAMAEFVDGDLQHVTPHETDTRVLTVQDRLDVLAERGVERADESPAAPVA